MNEQLDLFASLYEKPKLPKHVRLIECFAGIGAQAKALEVLGVDFEHWRTVEWSWQSITAYNANGASTCLVHVTASPQPLPHLRPAVRSASTFPL